MAPVPLQSKSYKYDSVTRPIETLTTIDRSSYTERTTYDQVGRVLQNFDTAGANRGSEYHDTPYGHVEKITETQETLRAMKIHQRVVSVDARCNVLTSYFGPQRDQRTYVSATDRLLTNTVTLRNFSPIQFLKLLSIEMDGLFGG